MPFSRITTLVLLVFIIIFSCNKNDNIEMDTDFYIALPTPPVKVINTSGSWLVYEMHIKTSAIEKVDIFYDTILLLSYSDFITKDNLHIASIWLEYPEEGWEKQKIVHEFEYRDSRNTLQLHTFNLTVENQYTNPKTIQFPVPQGVWLAEGAPGCTSYHTRAIFPYQNLIYDETQKGYLIGNNPQRFAIDYALLKNNLPYINNGKNLTDWYCYNLPVKAVEGGKVLFTENSIPDNTTPGELDYETNTSNASGNVVYIGHPDGTISVYCHLVPNSIVVNVGNIVTTGQILGRLGNSGNSFAPHLHMHILTNPEDKELIEYADGLFMESLPYKFSEFNKLGALAPGYLDESPIIPFTPNMHESHSEMLPSESDVIEF
ncbi:M23 family metallopeptidase [Xanthomarina sp. F2636L]|uniref:M23 family metallopeptidase n=1 Tax=Xanthomarina sp. F2636L TaxID=2996018 RepID=UPI00225E1C6D|nr:M23 family metallopeptidase [Xanthomarina sp. F2636L]MCX7551049.1 M23 family metallopeptidase [Xanthomarina sp. F2636L]